MTERRRPGRVPEPASSHDDSGRPAQIDQTESERKTSDGEEGVSSPEQMDRKPGKVTDPSEPLGPATDTEEPLTPIVLSEIDPPPRSAWFSVFWLLLACIAFWGIGSATLNLVELWHRHTMLAAPLGLASVVLVGLLIRAMWLEWLAMRDVDALADRRKALVAALERDDIDALKLALRPTLDKLKVRDLKLIEEFEEAVVDSTDCADYLRTFENIVLQPLDEKAKEVVRNGSIATATAVAIVPHPAFDAVVVLWRALVMTRRIGSIYGLRPGGLSSWRLLSHSLKSALLAAGMDTITTILADASASTMARMLKPLAEGGVIGVRIFHLGRLTVDMCRPVSKLPR